MKRRALALLGLGFLSPASAAIYGAAFDSSFADPSVLVVGGTSYAFATNNDDTNVPVATSTDGGQTWTLSGTDALPTLGAWANTGKPWAPDVRDRGDGTYIMYYTASNKDPATQCVGIATATTPTGPYTPQSTVFACPADQGGAIDPSGFNDTDGTRWAVYKIDGNSLGGATCGPDGAGPNPTPIMLQQMAADGTTLVNGPTTILDHDFRDGPLIEAPVLIKISGTYFLFFSSNC